MRNRRRPDESGAALHWLGEAAETADELLGRPCPRGFPPEKRRCARLYLEELLADGPLSSRTSQHAAIVPSIKS